MAPLPPAEERPLRAIGARKLAPPAPDRAAIVTVLRKLAAGGDGLVAIFDARGIAGERHLLSAWAHLGRSRARGESRLRDRSAEFALYVAGDDQLPRALEKIGVRDDTEAFVLVTERSRDPRALLPEFGLAEAPEVFPKPPDVQLLERLGISRAERETVPASAWEGLVLERVALLELSPPAKSGTPSTQKH